MVPNLNVPLYLVAPEDRRSKVFEEVNRPTFSLRPPRLSEKCRYIPFSALRDQVEKASPFIQFMKPDFIEEISESCEAT
jgi:hypothetical protein